MYHRSLTTAASRHEILLIVKILRKFSGRRKTAKMKTATVVFTVLMSLSVLAIEPVKTNAWYVDGRCYQEQTINNVSVRVTLVDWGSHNVMWVMITNLSATPLDVIPGPNYFRLAEMEPKQQELKYKSENDLVRSVNHRVMWASLFAGVAAGLATETSTVRTQTPYGSSYTTITTPDYYARSQYLDLANQAQSGGQRAIHDINQQYLQRTTLFSNSSLKGAVVFNRERKATLTEARISIAGNEFSFLFPPNANVPPPPTAPVDYTARVQPQASAEVAATQPASSSPSVQQATVEFWSQPNGAGVELDGKYIGTTPSTVTVAAGQHTITMRKKGCGTWQKTIKVASQDVRVAAYMEQFRITLGR
jgi:hypothetical protein